MANENFLLLSLKEDKAKQLAQVISNETSRKILDMLAKKEYTETELAKALNLPISTVHYNLKHLLEAKLVKAEEFHYSPKGKEVNHYSLANKYVIIAPDDVTPSFREKLKSILPVALVVFVASALIKIYTSLPQKIAALSPTAAMEDAFSEKMLAAPETTSAMQSVSDKITLAIPIDIAFWFLLGGLFALVVFIIITLIRARKKQ